MRYTVTCKELDPLLYGPNMVGAEIRPPLENVAAEGLSRALLRSSIGGVAIEASYVTCNDEAATTLLVATEASVSGVDVSVHISRLMDPLKNQNIDIGIPRL